MRYILDAEYSFCGWEGLPFALIRKTGKAPRFLDREQFMLFWSCDGVQDIDADALEGETALIFSSAVQAGIVKEAPEDARLQLHDYVRYPCCYRSDVQLSLTGECNYRCRHCFQSAPHGLFGKPTTKQLLDEVDQLAECGVFNVSLTGGEPLIHEGFWEVVDRIIQNNLRLTTIYTNGARVNQELLDGFKQRGIKPSWSVSFDGLGCHDYIRGVDGAEKAAIRAIELLVKNDFPVGCAYTLTKRTVKAFRDTVNYLASLGVHSVKSGHTQSQGEWLSHKDEWLTDHEYLAFYKEYIPQYFADGRPLSLQFEGLFAGYSDQYLKMSATRRRSQGLTEDCNDMTASEDEPSVREPANPTVYRFMTERNIPEDDMGRLLSCGSFGSAFYIGPMGRVLPCMGLDGTPAGDRFPNMHETPLKEILSKGTYFMDCMTIKMSDVFDHNPEECAECGSRSHCGSGCRASAIGSDGDDFLACDKRTCMTCKEDWAGQIRKALADANAEGFAN